MSAAVLERTAMSETDTPTTTLKVVALDFDLIREQALSTFDIQRAEVAKAVAKAVRLKVTDDESREIAKKEKFAWVKRRTGLAAKKKTALEDTKRIVAIVGDVADSFQSEFDKAEQHLAAQIDAYDDKIATEKQAAIDAAFNAKNDRLIAAGLTLPRILVDSMSDIDIDDKISEAEELALFRKAQAEKDAKDKSEAERLAAEEKERNRIEAEKLAVERAEFAKQQAELKAEQDRQQKIRDAAAAEQQLQLDAQKADLEAARKKLADDQTEQQRKTEAENYQRAEREREQREAEQQKERDRIAETERVRVEAEQKEAARVLAEQAEKDAEAARQRAELLQPDRERLLAFADRVSGLVGELPRVSSTSIDLRCVAQILIDAAQAIRRIVAEKLK